ncbi:MAG: hypothetical protein LUG16_08405 [Candidatus Gastranaerophilales bacterium]|nr:hypothetical protein [Candidatus Gastranaerophilales bacterium]MCD7879937.1 hypothetical protein [Candidatus Gastranaerophilales bacterium]
MECKDFEPSIIQEKRILRLCKRLDKFTFEDILTIADDIQENVLELMLTMFVQEKRLTLRNDTYFYNKAICKTQIPQIFQYHSKEDTDLIIRCFCANISSNVACNIVKVGDGTIVKFYQLFREKIYNRQEQDLIKNYSNDPQIARHRIFFEQEVHFYTYKGTIYVSDKIYESNQDRGLTPYEITEFKKVVSYISRSIAHNKNEYFLHNKIAEAIWRRNRSFQELYQDLKVNLLNIS